MSIDPRLAARRRRHRARRDRRGRSLLAERLEPRLPFDAAAPGYDAATPLWFDDVRPISVPGSTVGALASASGAAGQLAVDASTTDVDRWIVRLTPQATSELGALVEAEGVLANQFVHFSVLRGLGLPGQLLVETTCFSSPDVVRALATNPAVATFEPESVILLPQAIPNDPLFGRQDALENTSQSGGTADADLDAPAAWDVSTGSSDVVVGVIDTGMDGTHPDLAANLWVNTAEIAGNGLDDDANGFIDDVHGFNFIANNGDTRDDHRHGTHVAGTIAAVGNNGVGIAGVSWNARLMALKFLDEHNRGVTSDAIRAVNYATMMASRSQSPVNVRVLNASWGATGDFSPGLSQAIESAGAANILVVAAAGNGNVLGRGVDNDSQPFYPANYTAENLISVAATDQNDNLAIFSNYGATTVDVAAPGVGILSTEPGGSYATRNGTSMAAPHVSGLAALLWSVVPDATVTEVQAAIFAGVDPIDSLKSKVATGGRINAAQSLAADTYVPRVSLRRADDILDAGATVQEIEVRYTDNRAIDVTSLDGADLVITPRDQPTTHYPASLVRLDVATNGPTRTAIYRMAAPGGNWDALDNGVYDIRLRSGQVHDAAGNVSPEQRLGSFRVDAPNEGEIRVDLQSDGVDVAPGNGLADDGQGHISLRGAIQEANAQNGANTLVLGPGTFRLDRTGDGEDASATGDLDIFDRLTILGDPHGGTMIDAGGLDRIFDVQPGAVLKLHFVTLRGGRTAADGGAIRNRGVLELRQSELLDNQGANGGAIANEAELTIVQSTLAGNQAAGSGGGLANSGRATLENSTVSGNSSQDTGGAVAHSAGSLIVQSSTLVQNSSLRGGGVTVNSSATFVNTIVAKNSATTDPDVSGVFTSQGSNLIGSIGGASGFVHGVIGDKVGTVLTSLDPLLGPLARNDGPTSTHLPQPGSPAINAGNNLLAPAVDQRGFARLIDDSNRADIGAVERVQVAIRGTKFHDVDADGKRDEEDAGLAGWTIYLDLNQNGRLDDSEPRTITDAEGKYEFTGLAPGAYTVAEVPQAFFTRTLPRQLTFQALPPLEPDASPTGIIAGDFDRDGRVDLAVVQSNTNQVAVYANAGRGTFLTPARYQVGNAPSAMATADFNGDGFPDLAVTNAGSNSVSLLLGQSGGQFILASGFATLAGAQPSGLAVGDWDLDGDVDMAVANELLDSVTLYANDGQGTFAATGTIAVGRRPRALAAAAIDAVPGLDLVVANLSDDSLHLLGNNGRGVFTASAPIFSGGDQPVALAAADFDDDGDLDITVANRGSSLVALLLNRGDGTLASSVSFPVAATPTALLAADVDNDSAMDVVVASEATNALSILVNTRDVTPRAGGQDAGDPLPPLEVNSFADKPDLNPGDGIVDTGTPGEITLRAAIMEANAYPGPDSIGLPVGTIQLTLAGRDEDNAATGDLDITSPLTIIGSGPTTSIVDAAGIDRVFHVLPGATVSLIAFQIRGGDATGALGGGAIRNEGHLTINGSFAGNNRADGPGGAVISSGSDASLVSIWSQFYDNVSSAAGGGIAIESGGASFNDSDVVRNQAGGDGGGIAVFGSTTDVTFVRAKVSSNNAGTHRGGGLAATGTVAVSVIDSTILGNQAAAGGAYYLASQGKLDISGSVFVYNRTSGANADGGAILLESSLEATITNSTFTGNVADGAGGAIWTRDAKLALTHVTIARNEAGSAGGIAAASGSGTTRLGHSVVVENTASTVASDLQGAFQTDGYNFVGVVDGATGIQAGVHFDRTGTSASPLDAKLGPYQDHGGPTGTLQPLWGSPLIDAGVPTTLNTDQRGAPRSLDGDGDGVARPDLGATEFGFFVDTFHDTVDTNPGDGLALDAVGNTSLRAALMEANASGHPVVIYIPSGTYALESGQLEISSQVELVGSDDTIITARGASRVLNVSSSGIATIRHATLTEGTVGYASYGGVIYNAGALRLDDVVIAHGSAGGGGGLANFGTVVVRDSIFSQNSANGGGAIHNSGSLDISGSQLRDSTGLTLAGGLQNDGTAVLVGVEIANNEAGVGAGIYSTGTLQLVRSTVAENRASVEAVGIYNFGHMEIDASTISGNVASHPTGGGGGILNRAGTLAVRNSTITGNFVGGSGGGIWSGGKAVFLQNTIVAGNTCGGLGSPDLSGLYESGGGNLIGINRNDSLPPWDASDPPYGNGYRRFEGIRDGILSDRVGTEANPLDPKLSPLADHGGPTRTHALLAGSPALDAGPLTSDLERDQRGVPRGGGTRTDAGAFEASSQTIYFVNSRADSVDDNTADSIAADSLGRTTVRAAIMQANAHAGSEWIVIPTGTFPLTLLGADEDNSATGDLDITGSLAIYGAGGGQTVIDARQLDRGFDVQGAGAVSLDGITVVHGLATSGGGIANAAPLTLIDVSLEHNHALANGGGISSQTTASLTIVDTTVSENTADQLGGGVYLAGSADITGSRLTGNSAESGGGIAVAGTGTLTLRQTTIDANLATELGGGILLRPSGRLTAENVTLSGNRAGNLGGGLANQGTTLLVNATVVANRADPLDSQTPVATRGAGIFTDPAMVTAVTTLRNTVVAGNTRNATPIQDDLLGAVAAESAFNLIEDAAHAGGLVDQQNGNRVGVAPLLSVLLPSLSNTRLVAHIPLAGSPLVDAGTNDQAPAVDQFGNPRPQDGNLDGVATADIGAVERYYGEIHGTIFQDLNRSDARDENEPTLANWTVYLDLDRDGRLDATEPRTTTNSSGQYVFRDLPPSPAYYVSIQPVAGFQQSTPRTPSFTPLSSTVALGDDTLIVDFDQDGERDAIGFDRQQGKLLMAKADGAGGWSVPTTTPMDLSGVTGHVSSADLDFDGYPDFYGTTVDAAELVIWWNDQSGHVSPPQRLETGLTSLGPIVLGDFDADQSPELAVGGVGPDGGEVLVMKSHGSRTFSVFSRVPAASSGPGQPVAVLAAADVDGDGRDELLTIHGNQRHQVAVLSHLETGPDSQRRVLEIGRSESENVIAAEFGDLDLDGDRDLVFETSDGFTSLRTAFNDGTGNFDRLETLDFTPSPSAFHLIDIDNDGDLDVITTLHSVPPQQGTDGLGIAVNDGDGRFGPGLFVEEASSFVPHSVAAADVTGDGRRDWVVQGPCNNPGVTAGQVCVGVYTQLPLRAQVRSLGAGETVREVDFGQMLSVSVENAAEVTESASQTMASFAIRLSAPSNAPTVIHYETVDGTAISGRDYEAARGEVTFAAGETVKFVKVPILDDPADEFTESFALRIFDAENASIGESRGSAAILDDDAVPRILITPFSVSELDRVWAIARFEITLSEPSEKPVYIRYSVKDGTATSGPTSEDYSVGGAGPEGTLDLRSEGIVYINVRGDFEQESTETVHLELSGAFNAVLESTEAIVEIRDNDPNLTVNSLLDKPDLNPGDGIVDTGTPGEITLRAAIMEAVALPGDDRVVLPAGNYVMSRAGANENTGATGDFDLPANSGFLWIQGAGVESTTLDANQLDRLFHVQGGAELQLTGLTIQGGRVTGGADGGAIRVEAGAILTGDHLLFESNQSDDEGGAISSAGHVELSAVTLGNNVANQGGAFHGIGTGDLRELTVRGNRAAFGAGVFARGSLSIAGGLFDQNIAETADGAGGALFVSGNVQVDGGTFSHNVAGTGVAPGNEDSVVAKGGAIFVDQTGRLSLGWSTLESNTTIGDGAGIANQSGSVTLRNVTLAMNSAQGSGGALWNGGGTVDALHVTVARNTSIGGGGAIANAASGTVSLENTLIAENVGAGVAPEVSGTIQSRGHNLVGIADGATGFVPNQGDLVGSSANPVLPMLGELDLNGSTTQTIRLLTGSPAIDAGRFNLVDRLPTDQKRIARVQDGDGDGDAEVDIGAYELRFNQMPVIAAQTLLVEENQPRGTRIGVVSASDPDDEPILFRILEGNVGGTFTIDQSTGAITANSMLDFESQSEYRLTVEVEDTLGILAKNTVTITVQDVNEPPVILGGGIDDRSRLHGASPESFTLANVFGDPDRGDSLSYRVTSSNPALVEASITDGALTLTIVDYSASQDREPATITVSATDPSDLSVSETFRVSVSPAKTFEYRLVLVPQPTAQVEVTTLPTSLSSIVVGQSYYAEVWLRDMLTSVATGLPDTAASRGVEQAAVDITFQASLSSVTEPGLANYSGLMMTLSGNVAQRFGESLPGRVDNFGARTLTPTRGVGPGFARLGFIELTATAAGVQTIALEIDPANAATRRSATSPAGGSIALQQIAVGAPVSITIDPEGGSGATRLFGPAINVATGTRPVAMTALDLDQDGDLDFAAAAAGGPAVSLLENRPSVSYRVTLAPGGIIENLDFGDQAAAGEIRGQAFDDLNQNGVKDLGEPGLADWTVYLDQNGNSGWDPEEPRAVSDSNGEYVFHRVPALTPHRVREVPREGWSTTIPGDGTIQVTLLAGEIRSGVDFGNKQSTGGAFKTGIRGRLYRDLNGDGRFDPEEPVLGDRFVYIDLNHNGQRDTGEPQDRTDPVTGEYEFASLGAAIYSVRVELQPSEKQTFPLGNELNIHEYKAGDGPQSIAIGDLNGDGKPDLAVANGVTNNVSLLMNLGEGQFSAPRQEPVGFGAVAVAIHDLNGDNQPDVVAVNNYSSSVTVLMNHGASGFTSATYAVGIGPRSVAIADFDRDGDPDLAVANELSNSVSVLRNSGTGTFPTKVTIAVTDAPVSLAATDADRDGDVDLAVAAFDGDRLALLANTTEGGVLRFAAPVLFTVGNGPFAVTAVDVNADGADDLVSANVLSDEVSVLINRGNGQFARAVAFPAGKGPTSVIGVDIDRDGDSDLAVTTGTASKLAILRNVGGSQFTAPESFGVANFPVVLPYDVAAADVDRDGSVDLAIANGESDNVAVLLNALIPGAHLVRHTEEQDSTGYDFGLLQSSATLAAVGDDGGETTEDAVRTINAPGLLSNDSLGTGGGSLSLSRVDASSRLGAPVTASPDGAWSYDPSHVASFQQLIAGQTLTDDFTYSISDGRGGTSTAIVTILIRGQNDWTNPRDPYDVNADGFVVPLDALIVINAVNDGGARALPGLVGLPTRYLDTNGDNFLAPIDALKVINRLNASQGEGERVDATEQAFADLNADWAPSLAIDAALEAYLHEARLRSFEVPPSGGRRTRLGESRYEPSSGGR